VLDSTCVSIGDAVSVIVSADGKLVFRLRHVTVLYTVKVIKLVTPMSTRMSK
jgi:hypothetical protein